MDLRSILLPSYPLSLSQQIFLIVGTVVSLYQSDILVPFGAAGTLFLPLPLELRPRQ